MCLVEIGRPMMDRNTGKPILDEKGEPKLQFLPKLETACTNPVSDGMVVLTQSEKAKAGQKSTIEFLLTSHPLDCPICDKGGECPLQNLTMAHGPGKSRYLYDEKMHLAKNFPLGELIVLDQERCIQCARCIRFQDEIAGDSVLGFDRAWPLDANRISFRSWVRFRFLRQHHRHLPRRRADDCRFSLRRAPLGVECFRFDLLSMPGGMQYYLQYPA